MQVAMIKKKIIIDFSNNSFVLIRFQFVDVYTAIIPFVHFYFRNRRKGFQFSEVVSVFFVSIISPDSAIIFFSDVSCQYRSFESLMIR